MAVDGYAGPLTFRCVSNHTVEKNERHALVGWVQKKLNSLGYNSGNVDNYAGPITMSAINKFQKDYGLGVGYLGGTDWYYLLTLQYDHCNLPSDFRGLFNGENIWRLEQGLKGLIFIPKNHRK